MALGPAPPAIEYGRRLIPNIIDDTARVDPEREVFLTPRTTDPADGWKVVTYRELANAINHFASVILEELGRPAKDSFPTIAYVGPNDARYIVMMVAAIKAGYRAFFISPRNSVEGQTELLRQSDCHTMVFPESYRAMAQPWLKMREMKTLEIAPLDFLLDQPDAEPVPYCKTFEEAEWDPVVVLHTSGSTGFPKPVIVRVGMVACADAMHYLPDWQGYTFTFRGLCPIIKRSFIPMPLYHSAGVYAFINAGLYWGMGIAMGIDRPISPSLIAQCLEYVDVDSVMLPPVIVEHMTFNEAHLAALKKLKVIAFGGGPLAPEAGDKLVENGLFLSNAIGSTECAPYPMYFQSNPELWQYFVLNEEALGAYWRPIDESNLRELVIKRRDEKPCRQGFFYTFPDAQEYSTNDLFEPHPTLPWHWKYRGRIDNIIVFSNGEKLNPATIEDMVGAHPSVKGVLVVGHNRFQPGLIIETFSDVDTETLLDTIWSVIEATNKLNVAHGQIVRELVIVSNPDKPFLRSGKGSIQVAGTLKLYEPEIDLMYEKAQGDSSDDVVALDIESEELLSMSILGTLQSRLKNPALQIDTDFFSIGVDSLQVIAGVKLLKKALKMTGAYPDIEKLNTAAFYENPTPRLLARKIMQTIVRPRDEVNTPQTEEEAMTHLYEKYTRDLLSAKEGKREPEYQGQTVVLTGSTGMLGSYLLDLMINDERVKTVVCLNRTSDGGLQKQTGAMESRGLKCDFTKVEFYHIDITKPDFGLSSDQYTRLLQETDRWIHNAWPVNFNMSIHSFEPQLKGVRNVADFAAKADKRVAVTFVSSIATGERWDANRGPLPEERLEDMRLAGGGYGRSKFLGTLILDDAAKVGDFTAAIIRVGQVGGPLAEAGAWNRHEWLPSVIASSLFLRALPSDLGFMDRVDWIPAESIANLVLEASGVVQQPGQEYAGGYFHGVNPQATTWQVLAPAVQEFYGKDRLPRLVSFAEWVKLLERSEVERPEAISANPGLKLLDTYRDMVKAAQFGMKPVEFSMDRTVSQSRTMRDAHAVTPQLMQHWCKQWGH